MRKYPPVSVVFRKSLKPYTFNGTDLTIPENIRVCIPIHAIHHDERYFPEPDEFDPERFNSDMEKSRHPMHFLAFGNGPRNCIGKII